MNSFPGEYILVVWIWVVRILVCKFISVHVGIHVQAVFTDHLVHQWDSGNIQWVHCVVLWWTLNRPIDGYQKSIFSQNNQLKTTVRVRVPTVYFPGFRKSVLLSNDEAGKRRGDHPEYLNCFYGTIVLDGMIDRLASHNKMIPVECDEAHNIIRPQKSERNALNRYLRVVFRGCPPLTQVQATNIRMFGKRIATAREAVVVLFSATPVTEGSEDAHTEGEWNLLFTSPSAATYARLRKREGSEKCHPVWVFFQWF